MTFPDFIKHPLRSICVIAFPIFIYSCSTGSDDVDLSKVKPVELAFYRAYAINELSSQLNAAFDYSEFSDTLKNRNNQLRFILQTTLGNEIPFFEKNKNKLDSILSIKEIRSKFPMDMKYCFSHKPETIGNQKFYKLYFLSKPYHKSDLITGKDIASVESYLDEQIQTYNISLEFTPVGTKKFAELTRNNIGRGIAILVDNQVVSCPIVQNEISEGKVQISGNFTAEEAENLVLAIKAGQKWNP